MSLCVSVLLQVAYEKLTIEYGFSNYAVFGMAIGATIVLGFVFGGVSSTSWVCACVSACTYVRTCIGVYMGPSTVWCILCVS